jgi:pyruvate ferredoxin oxidoreductase gamma subunit
MKEIRFHGLGGQGVVLSSHLIGRAAFYYGMKAQSFPFFTTAMRGGTVTAYTRIDQIPINNRSFIYTPNILVLFAEDLLYQPNIVQGIDPDGVIIVNSHGNHALSQPKGFNGSLFQLNAYIIAQKTIKRPILSTIMAGALLGSLTEIPFQFLSEAIEHEFSSRISKINQEGARMGFDLVNRSNGGVNES